MNAFAAMIVEIGVNEFVPTDTSIDVEKTGNRLVVVVVVVVCHAD